MRAIIVYGSFVGNTETMAGYIASGLRSSGIEVEVRDVINTSVKDLDSFDLVLLGSPTYEPKMLQDDMLPFYSQLGEISLGGKLAAAFGPGDSAWPDYCTAVEMLESRLRETGATLILDCYTIDGIVEEKADEAIGWGQRLAAAARARSPV